MPEIGEFNEIYLYRERGYFGVIPPVMGIVRATDAQTSANFTTPFFRADRPYRVVHGYVRQEVAAAELGVEGRGVHVVLPSACWIASLALLVLPFWATTLMAARTRL